MDNKRKKKKNTFTNCTLRKTNEEEKIGNNPTKKEGQKEKEENSPLGAKHN